MIPFFSSLQALERSIEREESYLILRKRSLNRVYPCGLKAAKIVSTYNKVDTYDGEQESIIAITGGGAS